MMRKFKKITSLILLLVLLLPSIVKLEHHHKHYAYNLTNEKDHPVLQDNCPICNFEFSVFISGIENIDLQNESPLDYYCNNYNSHYNSNLSQYSFLLRAPPDQQI